MKLEEYKQLGKEAEAMLNSDLYSEEAKAFLQSFYQSVFVMNLELLVLSNEELLNAIAELRQYMNMVSTGEWTGVHELPESQEMPMKADKIVTIDGKIVNNMQQPGLYIIRNRDGKVYKVLR